MASPPREGKKKEIYKYVAPWTVFAMNWSMRLDKRWRLAIGSFIEDYTNKVSSFQGQNRSFEQYAHLCRFK